VLDHRGLGQTIALWRVPPSGFGADHQGLARPSNFGVPSHFGVLHISVMAGIPGVIPYQSKILSFPMLYYTWKYGRYKFAKKEFQEKNSIRVV
jgi:hypothetical protein